MLSGLVRGLVRGLARGLAGLALLAGLAVPGDAQLPLTGAGAAGPALSFTTLNPAAKTGTPTFSNGNLTIATTATAGFCGNNTTCGSQVVTPESGTSVFYFTLHMDSSPVAMSGGGLGSNGANITSCPSNAGGTTCFWVQTNGFYFFNANGGASIGFSLVSGDELDIAWAPAAQKVYARKNHTGNWNNSATADPCNTAAAGGISIALMSSTLYAVAGVGTTIGGTRGGPITANYGASAFTNAPACATGWPGP